jgi:hypothetical protein
MNKKTVNAIVNLAREAYNARRNQGQARLMQIQNNLNILKYTHGNAVVTAVYRQALRRIAKINNLVLNAAHKFKVGPRVKTARPVLNYLPSIAVNKIVTEIRKRKRNNNR